MSFWHPVSLLSSWFGVGLIPGAPGTWGSIAALPMAWYVLKFHGPMELAILGTVLFLVGCWSAGVYARRTNDDDPGPIVIDEVAAQCLVLTAVPASPAYFVIAFAAFRIADIFKPWPASWADRSIKGGFGIMLDDILAGAYAWALMYTIVFILD